MIYPNMKAEMARSGINVSAIAGHMGVCQKTIYNWFNGTTSITKNQCSAIRDEFFPELSLDYLFSESPAVASVEVRNL